MTRALFLHCLLYSLSCLIASPALAQDVSIPARLSLAEAIRLADEHSPTLAVARQQAALAGSDVIASRQRPNPVFEAASDGYRPGRPGAGAFGNSQELTLQLSQELEIGGRRGARTRAALAGEASAGASLADAVRQVRQEVGRAYFALVGARAEADAAAVALGEIDRIIAVNRAKYEQGEISGGELRRLEVERLRFTDDALSAELATRNATSALRAMLGSNRLDLPIEPVEGLAVPEAARTVANASDLLTLALGARPDVAALRHEQEQARSDQQLQRALRTPAPTVAGGYKRDFGDSGIVFGISIPLPLFDRNAAGMARADTASRLADARLHEVETAVSVEVQQSLDLVDVSRRRVEALERDYLAMARDARDSVAAAYRAGAAELIDFLDAQRAFRDVQRAHTRALLELRLSLFELQSAIGGEPLP